jgi:hypothetical protein
LNYTHSELFNIVHNNSEGGEGIPIYLM